MKGAVSAAAAKALVHDGGEIAFLDVREAGEFGEGHPLFAVPCPYSRLEGRIGDLVPRRTVRTLLIDGGDGVSERAAQALERLGYEAASWIAGGAQAWEAAGHTLFKGVNVPSKTLGELAEHVWRPATVDAATLARWRKEGRPFRLFDARPPSEYAKMRVPGAVCLPNGELAHRFPVAIKDETAPLVVTCAGRTRGIIGALGLKIAGLDAPVHTLANGTQGWALAGFELERGNEAAPFPALDAAAAQKTRARADALLARHDIPVTGRRQIEAWRRDETRTVFLLDLRAAGEIADDPAPAFTPAPSGQLVQATDQWVGVRHARLVLLDDLGLRAGLAAFWLRQLGYETSVALIGDDLRTLPRTGIDAATAAAAGIGAAKALERVGTGRGRFVDVRSSAAFRSGHVSGALWGIRPRLARLPIEKLQPVYLIGGDPIVADLAVRDLHERGFNEAARVEGGHDALVSCGAAIEESPESPSPAEAIDFLYFVHDRHDGNLNASRRYLAWEQGLIGQLDEEERDSFHLEVPRAS